jgi:hypothetical protein
VHDQFEVRSVQKAIVNTTAKHNHGTFYEGMLKKNALKVLLGKPNAERDHWGVLGI